MQSFAKVPHSTGRARDPQRRAVTPRLRTPQRLSRSACACGGTCPGCKGGEPPQAKLEHASRGAPRFIGDVTDTPALDPETPSPGGDEAVPLTGGGGCSSICDRAYADPTLNFGGGASCDGATGPLCFRRRPAHARFAQASTPSFSRMAPPPRRRRLQSNRRMHRPPFRDPSAATASSARIAGRALPKWMRSSQARRNMPNGHDVGRGSSLGHGQLRRPVECDDRIMKHSASRRGAGTRASPARLVPADASRVDDRWVFCSSFSRRRPVRRRSHGLRGRRPRDTRLLTGACSREDEQVAVAVDCRPAVMGCHMPFATHRLRHRTASCPTPGRCDALPYAPRREPLACLWRTPRLQDGRRHRPSRNQPAGRCPRGRPIRLRQVMRWRHRPSSRMPPLRISHRLRHARNRHGVSLKRQKTGPSRFPRTSPR